MRGMLFSLFNAQKGKDYAEDTSAVLSRIGRNRIGRSRMGWKQKDEKGSGYAFDPEDKAPILTASHVKLPVYK